MQRLSIIVGMIAVLIGFLIHFFAPIFIPTLSAAIAFILGAVISLVLLNVMMTKADTSSEEDEAQITLYVGNLPYRVHEGDVKELFSQHGFVSSVRLVRDRKTGRRKGFGFVEMSQSGAKIALEKLNDFEFQERSIKVREAKSQDQSPEKASATDD